jgi:hypothetical protein
MIKSVGCWYDTGCKVDRTGCKHGHVPASGPCMLVLWFTRVCTSKCVPYSIGTKMQVQAVIMVIWNEFEALGCWGTGSKLQDSR